MSETVFLRGAWQVVCDCISCGVVFTVPKTLHDQHRAEGGYHHCPNGHSQGWDGKTCERERLRQERDRLKQQIAQKDDEIRDKEKEILAAAKQVTKMKKRTANGVCPCCTRSFTNLRRHLATKHPTFAESKGGNVKATVQ